MGLILKYLGLGLLAHILMPIFHFLMFVYCVPYWALNLFNFDLLEKVASTGDFVADYSHAYFWLLAIGVHFIIAIRYWFFMELWD